VNSIRPMPNNTIEAIPTLAKIVNGLPDLLYHRDC
jgi:hypothetical protein